MKPLDSGDVSDHPYQSQFEAFFKALAQGTGNAAHQPGGSGQDPRVIFAADKSAALGRPVKLSH